MNKHFSEDCPRILKLIDLILTIPATSAENERGFSLLKITKTKFRTRMNNESLNDRMALSLLTPDVSQFNPSPHVEHWYSMNSRRLREVETSDAEMEIDDKEDEPILDEITDVVEDCEISEENAAEYFLEIDSKIDELDKE